ncbi:hypothetical protein [Bradyrhizobium sp. SSUT18]|uniref:hypothetical protein n=1 Tax=Bradyrhizobium sp. SSUT18 TaxID=3040602 RepID=UPI003264DEC5
MAATAPINCAMMKGTTLLGAIPVKVSDSDRAIVTPGLANEVDVVNQNTGLTISQQKANGLLSLGRWTAKA